MVGYRKYVKRDTVPEMSTINKKVYLYELIEECLHNTKRECDLRSLRWWETEEAGEV